MTAVMNQENVSSNRPSGVWRTLIRHWVPLALVFASLLMGVTVTAHHSSALSPIDEWVYSDYLNKLPDQLFIPRGQPIGSQALGEMACTGVREYGPMGPPCGSDYKANLDKFPQHGISSADGYTPLYFVITWVAAKAIQVVTRVPLLEAARFTGGFWLAGGILLFYWLLRLLRVRPIIGLGLGLAVIASPFAWWTYTFVSTDAPVFAFGAFLLVAAIKYTRAEWSGWWLPLAAVVATLFKITNILAVALVAVFLLLEFIFRRTRERRAGRRFMWKGAIAGRGDDGLLIVAVVTMVAGVLAEAGWLVVRAAIAVGPAANQGVTGAMHLKDFGAQFINFLPDTITSNVHITGRDALGLPIQPFIVEPLSWLCVAGVVASVLLYTWRRANSPLVYAIAVSSVFFAPMLAVALSVQGTYFPIPPRYGAALLPGFLVAAALLIRTRLSVLLVVAYPTFLLGYVILNSPTFR